MVQLSLPPSPQGSVQQQLTRQYAYLFQMAQQLNLALEQLQPLPAAVPGRAAPTAEEKQQYQTLKSLVIRTADRVRQEMDKLSLRLEGEYVAAGDFGSYVEKLSSYIEANPQALTQYYRFASDLQGQMDKVDAAFADYKAGTEGYIRTGIVDYDGALPVYGVAVGQNLTATEVDGEQVVDQNNFRATFTATKLSFWQDATEVAYVSNNRLYITNITVLDAVVLGQWKISGENGLVCQWIGG